MKMFYILGLLLLLCACTVEKVTFSKHPSAGLFAGYPFLTLSERSQIAFIENRKFENLNSKDTIYAVTGDVIGNYINNTDGKILLYFFSPVISSPSLKEVQAYCTEKQILFIPLVLNFDMNLIEEEYSQSFDTPLFAINNYLYETESTLTYRSFFLNDLFTQLQEGEVSNLHYLQQQRSFFFEDGILLSTNISLEINTLE